MSSAYGMNANVFFNSSEQQSKEQFGDENNPKAFMKEALTKQQNLLQSTQNVVTKLGKAFDTISKEDALTVLKGGMTESETRAVMNDPRMSMYMKEQNMDMSQATMDRFVQNRMVPNVKKYTQPDVKSSNMRMHKMNGTDIDWRPKEAVEQSKFASPEETRLQHPVSSSGRSHAASATETARSYYATYASNKMNGVKPTEQIIVGRGTSAGIEGTKGSDDMKKDMSSMNLHYGGVSQKELARYDPGAQKNPTVHKSVTFNMNKAYPTQKEIAGNPQSIYIRSPEEDERSVLQMEKFTSSEYTSIQAERNPTHNVLNQISSVNEREKDSALETDSRALQMKYPELDIIHERQASQLDSHDTTLKTVEINAEKANHGRSFKSMLEQLEQYYTAHREHDPRRSEHALSYNNEKRFESSAHGTSSGGMSTAEERKLYHTNLQNETVKNHQSTLQLPENAVATNEIRKVYLIEMKNPQTRLYSSTVGKGENTVLDTHEERKLASKEQKVMTVKAYAQLQKRDVDTVNTHSDPRLNATNVTNPTVRSYASSHDIHGESAEETHDPRRFTAEDIANPRMKSFASTQDIHTERVEETHDPRRLESTEVANPQSKAYASTQAKGDVAEETHDSRKFQPIDVTNPTTRLYAPTQKEAFGTEMTQEDRRLQSVSRTNPTVKSFVSTQQKDLDAEGTHLERKLHQIELKNPTVRSFKSTRDEVATAEPTHDQRRLHQIELTNPTVKSYKESNEALLIAERTHDQRRLHEQVDQNSTIKSYKATEDQNPTMAAERTHDQRRMQQVELKNPTVKSYKATVQANHLHDAEGTRDQRRLHQIEISNPTVKSYHSTVSAAFQKETTHDHRKLQQVSLTNPTIKAYTSIQQKSNEAEETHSSRRFSSSAVELKNTTVRSFASAQPVADVDTVQFQTHDSRKLHLVEGNNTTRLYAPTITPLPENGQQTQKERRFVSSEVNAPVAVRTYAATTQGYTDTEANSTHPSRKLYSSEISNTNVGKSYINAETAMYQIRRDNVQQHTQDNRRELSGPVALIPSRGAQQTTIASTDNTGELTRRVQFSSEHPKSSAYSLSSAPAKQQNDLLLRSMSEPTHFQKPSTSAAGYTAPGKELRSFTQDVIPVRQNSPRTDDTLYETIQRGNVLNVSITVPETPITVSRKKGSAAEPSNNSSSSGSSNMSNVNLGRNTSSAPPVIVPGAVTRRDKNTKAKQYNVVLI